MSWSVPRNVGRKRGFRARIASLSLRPPGSRARMSHHSRVQKIVIDVPGAEAHRAAEFWQGAVGVNLTQLFPDFPEYVGADLPYAEHLTLLIQELEEGHPRIHLDIHTDDVEAEVARL